MNSAIERLTAALRDRYRIQREIGAGGMATVYLAQDLRHDRKVAIKVLRAELAAVIGAERFLSEIKTTANLQHPHILPLHDSGEADSFLYYVMPYVEGESLRDRLNREKQLPIGDAVRIATEVASALDYAHRHNVIHRDIKPENVLLHDGQALVADFGIALAASKAGGSRMTETGMSLGTPTYMSPEQAMGEREITARSDVYALGCVLYEMLVGDPPFTGSTAQAIVAKVVTERPHSLISQRHTIPPQVEAAVLTALEKLPADRFASAAEFAQALADRTYTTTASLARIVPSRESRRWRLVAGMLAIGLVIAVAGAALGWMRQAPPGVVRRFYITMSQYAPDFGNPVISPDGARIVYSNTEGALMMRRGDDLTARMIPGSEAAWATAFSPDSRSIAINNGFPGALKIIPIDGGPVRTLVADSTYGSGIAWSEDDWIYFLHGEDYGRDLMRIHASGGTAEFVARPDSTANALFFYWPQVLPGGRKLLLTVYPIRGEPSIGVLDVSSGKVTLIAAGVKAHFAPTGHVLVIQSDGLQAARFDPSSGTVLGGFTTVAEGLFTVSSNTAAMALSNEGTLVYQPTPAAGPVVRVSRDGREEILDPNWRGTFWSVALSPDGAKLAVGLARGGRTELWVKALGQGTFTRLSAGGTQNYRPSWSPDGREVVFTSDQNGKITTYHVPADGSAPPSRLLPSVNQSVDEAAYSRDGQWIVFRGGSGGGRDIYAIRPGVDSSVRAIATGQAEEFSPALSPDGRWLAYASDETGRTEVYVRPFPNAGAAKYPVSHNGGAEPLWSHSGKELFFRDGAENLVAAAIAPGDAFRVVSEQVLFSTHDYATDNRHHSYTVSLDDRSLIFVKAPFLSGGPNQLVIVLNWFEELKRKVAE
jgi:serine/threonine protein kinase/Tol biopolymer transport system component